MIRWTALQAHAREQHVSELLVAGRTTDEIATALTIPRHAIRDHVKVTFTKVGVRSRPELTAVLGTKALAA